MTVLTNEERAQAAHAFAYDDLARADGYTLLRADIRAAINAIDDYFEANAVAINQAIPQPARAALTVRQKALLVSYVAYKRGIR